MRRRKKKSLEASLFPFLSILACVIGVLVLLICLIVLSQIDDSGVEETRQRMQADQANAADYEQARARLLELRTRAPERQAELNRLRNEPLDLAAMQAERDRLARDLDATRPVTVTADLAALDQDLAELKGQVEQGRASLQAIVGEVDKRKAGPAPATVRVRPSGSAARDQVDPTFVECDREGLQVFRAPGDSLRVRRAEIGKQPDWIKLLDTVSQNPRGTVIFLIREDAIPVYRVASRVAADRYCRNGKLPISGFGPLDLSAFAGGRR